MWNCSVTFVRKKNINNSITNIVKYKDFEEKAEYISTKILIKLVKSWF